MLIRKLLPHIKDIISTIHSTGEVNDDVICGGKVTRIFDTSFLEDKGVKGNIVYITIDDSIESITVLVHKQLFEEVRIKLGDVIVVEGKLNRLVKSVEFVSKAKTEIKYYNFEEPLRILGKNVKKLDVENS